MTKIYKDIIQNTVSNVFVKLINLINGIFVANFLGPALFGIKNALSLIIDYGGNTHLGLIYSHNIERNKSEHINNTYAETVSNITFTFLVIISILLFLSFFVVALFIRYSLVVKLSIMAIGIIVIFGLFDFFFRSILQSKKDFSSISKLNFIFGTSLLILIIPLTLFYKYLGFFIGSAITLYISLIFMYINRKTIFNPSIYIDRNILKKLFIKGLFLLSANFLWILLFSIDRLFITSFYSFEVIGYYSIGLFFSGFVLFLAQMVLNPLYPRIFQTNDHYSIVIKANKYFLQVLYYIIFSIIVFIPFITFIFPAYNNSINFIKILVFNCIFAPLLIYQYFLYKNKVTTIIFVSYIFFFLIVALDYAVVLLKLNILFIPIISCFILFLYNNTLNYIGYKQILNDNKQVIKEMIAYLWPLFYLSIGYIITWFLLNRFFYFILNFYIAKILQFMFITIWYLPILIKLEKDTKLLKQFFKYK